MRALPRRPRMDQVASEVRQLIPKIYRYIIRHDSGSAPNPFNGWCTLAICKPGIRRKAQRGDWVVGLRSLRNTEVVYAMQVGEDPIPFAKYWEDPRFRCRRPKHAGGASDDFSDNIYRPSARGGLKPVRNLVHGKLEMKRDTGGEYVLVAKRYWYFGRNSKELPLDLQHLVHVGRSYAVHVNRRVDDVERLTGWLKGWRPGVHGSPIAYAGEIAQSGTRTGCQIRTC